VGGDPAAADGVMLRVWDAAAILAASGGAGPSAAAPAGAAGSAGGPAAAAAAAAQRPLAAASSLASVRLFPVKQPPTGTVTAVAASDAAWPQLHLAVGLSSGGIQLMRGDADRGVQRCCPDQGSLQAATFTALKYIPDAVSLESSLSVQPSNCASTKLS
jgi:hypothetical protein